MLIGSATKDYNIEFLKNLKIELPNDHRITLLATYSGNGSRLSKGYLHSHVYCSIIYSSQDMETLKCPLKG